jgi:hypothetical protein
MMPGMERPDVAMEMAEGAKPLGVPCEILAH